MKCTKTVPKFLIARQTVDNRDNINNVTVNKVHGINTNYTAVIVYE